jgi:hypothetical protein
VRMVCNCRRLIAERKVWRGYARTEPHGTRLRLPEDSKPYPLRLKKCQASHARHNERMLIMRRRRQSRATAARVASLSKGGRCRGACLTCPRGTCPGKSFFPGHACPRIRLWGGDAGFSGFLFPFFNAASLPCESCGACVFTSRRVARYTAICHHHAELVSRRLIARQASQMRLSHVALLAVYGVPSCFSSQLVVVLSRHTPEALETTLIGPGTANDR